MKKLVALVVFTIAASTFAADPVATRVQNSAEELRAATICQNGTGTAQQTLTFTVSGPNCFFTITNIDNGASATTAPAATLLTTTTTNLGGWKGFIQAPAATFQTNYPAVFSNGMRGTLGANVTVVSNAAVTNVVFSVNACGYQTCI